MPDTLTLENIDHDPYFQKLSYDSQVRQRLELARDQLSKMPDFLKLSQQAKIGMMERIATAPPAFPNNRLTQAVASVGMKAQQGDKGAMEEILGSFRWGNFTQNELYSGIYSNLWTKYQIKKPQDARMEETPSLLNPLGKVLTQRFPEEEEKILQYYETVMNQDEKLRKKAQAIKITMPILGIIADMAPIYPMWAGTYKDPRGLAKIFMAPFEKAGISAGGRGGQVLMRLGGQAAHGAATAALWTGREIAMDLVNEKIPKEPGLQYWLKYGGKKFGEAYLADFAFNLVEGVLWPMAKGTGKVFRKGVSFKNFWENVEGEQVSRVISEILSGGYVDPTFVKTLPEAAQKVIKSSYNARRVFTNVPSKNAEDMLQAMAIVTGWNASPKAGGGYLLEKILGEGKKDFDDIAKAAKFINEASLEIGGPLEKVTKDSLLSGAAYDKVRLREVISGQVSDISFENSDVLTRLIAPTGGKWMKGRIKAFGQASLRAIGADEDTIAKFTVREWGDEIFAQVGKKDIASFPKVVKSGKEEVGAVRGFLESIKPYKSGNFKVGEELVREYAPSLARQHLFTPSWVEDQVESTLKGRLEKLGGGKVLAHLPAGDISFDSLDDLGKYVISETMEPEFYKSYIKRRFGLSLQVDQKSGKASLLQEGKKVIEADDFRSLVRENSEFLDKIPSHLGPELTVTTEGTLRVRYIKKVLTGPYTEVLNELDRFSDYKPKKQFIPLLSSKKGSIQVHKVTKEVEVILPDIAYRTPARTVKEAKRLLKEGISEWENLKFISHSKGYRVTPWGEGFAFYSTEGGGKVTYARTLAEAESVLEKVKIPSWAPELSGIDELDVAMNKGLMKGVTIPENMFKPTELKIEPRVDGLPWNVVMSQFYRPPEPWLVRAVAEGGDPKILQYFRNIEKTRQFVKAAEGYSGDAIQKIFIERTALGKIGKKLMPKKERVAVGAYLLQRRGQPELAAKLYENLSDWQKDVAKQIQDLAFGSSPETGAAVKFGITQSQWLEDYVPKIRKFYLENPKRGLSEGKAYRYLKDVFDGREPPHDLDAFFKHARTSDVINMAIEDDPLTMLLRYSAVGHREHYLGPIWREADEYIKKASKGNKTSQQMAARFAVYQGQIMGMPEGLGEKMVQESLQGLFSKLGVKGRLGEDVVSKIISLNYLSFMGFRPWLPIRNSFQIWTTVAPRIGNDWTIAGLREVAEDNKGTIYSFLRQRGVMTGTLPLFGAEEMLGSAASPLGKKIQTVVHKGLQWYKNSDDFTRAVAWRGSYLRFMDSIDRLNRGVWKGLDPDTATKRFMEMSGVVQLHPDLKEKVKFWMKNGQVQEAATTFADWMTEQTLFSYRKGMSPIWAKGMVGKLFGMFGTYPAYYVENIRTALKYMPRAAKLGYMARFLGNSALLYYTFKEGLGINANNFQPWTPASFSGGPMYDLMNKALRSMDTRSYAGRQARAELLGLTTKDGKPSIKFFQSDIGRMMTGYQLRSMIDAMESFQEGEIYRGFLNLGSFPLNPDWFED